MAKQSLSTLHSLYFLCRWLDFNLEQDGLMNSMAFYSPGTMNKEDFAAEMKAYMNMYRFGIQGMALDILGYVFSNKYLQRKAFVSYLKLLDSELAPIRRHLAEQRIADRAPPQLWSEEFKKTAHEIGLRNLVAVLDACAPSARHVNTNILAAIHG